MAITQSFLHLILVYDLMIWFIIIHCCCKCADIILLAC